MKTLYRMKENGAGGAHPIGHCSDARSWNRRGYGIFWTIQEFSEERKKEKLSQLNGFAIDIDTENKIQAQGSIKRGLLPSILIETKNGYHVYWLFKEPIEVNYSQDLEIEYKAIVVNRLIPFYGGDKNAADLCRLLRAPYFEHLKNPNEPFMVRPLFETEARYEWSQIEKFYPDELANKFLGEQEREAIRTLKLKTGGKDYFAKIYAMDCKKALEQLSGHPSVSGERYSFRANTSGTQNILVDGKGTSCWVDCSGKIGSLDKGGPTIWQWLYWYCRDHKQVFKTMKGVFGA